MAFVASSVKAYGAATSAAVPVPASAAAGHICVVDLFVEGTAAITVTPPTGFTLEATTTQDGSASWLHRRYWKRLDAADSGTYSFGLSASAPSMASASLWSGRMATGSPFDAGTGTTVVAANALFTDPCPPLSLTPTAAGADILGGAFSYGAGMVTGQTPVGWTQTALHGDGVLQYHKVNQPASSTGSVAPSGNDDWTHMLSSMPPDGGGGGAVPQRPVIHTRPAIVRAAYH